MKWKTEPCFKLTPERMSTESAYEKYKVVRPTRNYMHMKHSTTPHQNHSHKHQGCLYSVNTKTHLEVDT